MRSLDRSCACNGGVFEHLYFMLWRFRLRCWLLLRLASGIDFGGVCNCVQMSFIFVGMWNCKNCARTCLHTKLVHKLFTNNIFEISIILYFWNMLKFSICFSQLFIFRVLRKFKQKRFAAIYNTYRQWTLLVCIH